MSSVVARRAPRRLTLSDSPLVGPAITLVLVFVLLTLATPRFLTVRSISGILSAATITGIVSIGVTMLMIAGEFDLSVGALMAVGAFVFGVFTVDGGNPFLALLLSIGVPALLGAVNGLIKIWTGVPSFIVTLGTMFIYRGLLWVYSGGRMFQTIEDAPVYQLFNLRLPGAINEASGADFRVSLLWLLAVVLVFQLVLVRSRFGNHVFATGGNPGAAGAQGVQTRRTKLACFILSGTLAGLAGVMLFSQFRTAYVATGTGEELNAIAAAVVGGTLLTGGAGSIAGSVIGALLISTLRTGVVILNLPFIAADNFEAVVGVTIVGAAIINNWLRNRSG